MTSLSFYTFCCCRQVNELQRGLQSATEQMLAQDTKPADTTSAAKPVEGAHGGHHALNRLPADSTVAQSIYQHLSQMTQSL